MDSFGEVYAQFQPRIYRYLCNLSGEADALDLTQTVFLKVSRSLGDFRGDSSLATWIYRIATNTSHDHAVSSLAKQRGAELLFDEDSSLDEFHDPDSQGADRQFIRQEMNACIRGLIDQLPENYRAVLLLSEYEEFSNSEIAEMLGISLGTVKIRLHRARTHLRKSMECECNFYHDEGNELLCDRK